MFAIFDSETIYGLAETEAQAIYDWQAEGGDADELVHGATTIESGAFYVMPCAGHVAAWFVAATAQDDLPPLTIRNGTLCFK